LDHAAGIIANFTGGDDLTLHEVQEALSALQEQTTSQTEIVLGVIHDERMVERVQITLIITGLGAPTLEEALSKVSVPAQSQPILQTYPASLSAEILPLEAPATRPEPLGQGLSMVNTTNLDLPAFLRRRARLASPENG
jgi:cell division protein FtsZ